MQLKCVSVVVGLLGFFLSLPVYSHDLNPIFEELKTTSDKYEVTGTVCEQVARVELEHQYPNNKYFVENGIEYSKNGRTLGELDVVVFRRDDGHAILIGEVKCWRNLSKAHSKAVNQRARFYSYLENGGKGIQFHNTANQRTYYDAQQFTGEPPFILISQEDGESKGFDLSLPFSLEELMDLRQMLLNFQHPNGYSQRYY